MSQYAPTFLPNAVLDLKSRFWEINLPDGVQLLVKRKGEAWDFTIHNRIDQARIKNRFDVQISEGECIVMPRKSESWYVRGTLDLTGYVTSLSKIINVAQIPVFNHIVAQRIRIVASDPYAIDYFVSQERVETNFGGSRHKDYFVQARDCYWNKLSEEARQGIQQP